MKDLQYFNHFTLKPDHKTENHLIYHFWSFVPLRHKYLTVDGIKFFIFILLPNFITNAKLKRNYMVITKEKKRYNNPC